MVFHGALLAASLLSSAAFADEVPLAEVPRDGEAPVEAAPIEPAEDPAPGFAPRARVVYSNLLGLRVNPAGLVERLRVGWRHRLFRRDSVLLTKAWIDLGVETTLAPTYASVGARVEIQPAAFLNLYATYEYIGYFGALGAVMPIANTSADY